jgi:hypothetical protein
MTSGSKMEKPTIGAILAPPDFSSESLRALE